MLYEITAWNNDIAPALSSLNLNKMEKGIFDATDKIIVSLDVLGHVADDDVSDSIIALNAAGYVARIPPGRFYINKKITLNGLGVTAFNTDSILEAVGTVTDYYFVLRGGAKLSGFKLKGQAAITNTSVGDLSSGFNDLDTLLARTDLTGSSGVQISSEQSSVSDMTITNFPKFGIDNSINAASYSQPISRNITNCSLSFNGCGINQPEKAEYEKVSDNDINWNMYGVICAGGNNMFSNNNISHNRCNFLLLNGANGAHGQITGGNLNHGKLASFVADGVGEGEAIGNVSMFDGGALGLTIRNSSGINFDGCTISRMNIRGYGDYSVEDPAAPAGINKIINSPMSLMGVSYTVDVDGSNVVMSGNYPFDSDGEDTAYSDTFNTVFLDRNGYSREFLNGKYLIQSDRVKPSYFHGGGSSAGSIAIKLPTVLTNVAIACEIRITGLGVRAEVIQLSGYIGTSGTWTALNAHGNKTYEISCGKDANNFSIIYIGLMSFSMKWQTVSVHNLNILSMGALNKKYHYNKPWEIYQETTAQENVFFTVPVEA